MVIFLRSIDCHPDPRLQKYVDELDRKGIKCHVVGWDRENKYHDDNKYSYYKKLAKYGGGIRNSLGILGFNWYLFRKLINQRKGYSVIHACDFDTILPALFMKVFYGKKVIYDIFDWFVDGRHFNNKLLKKSILYLEKKALKYSDATIICDERRAAQINFIPYNLFVLPNIPKIKNSLLNFSDKTSEQSLRISYVGTMPSDRGLKKILESISKRKDIIFEIAGFGIMSELAHKYSDKYENIIFHGTVNYEEGLRIMGMSDLIIATYEKTCRNNIFAAPNKYYEGLMLGKPILTTEGTIVGDSTKEFNTGFVVGENIEDYNSFFDRQNLKEECAIRGENAKKLWKSKYAGYVETFMRDNYIPLIEK